MDDARAEVSVAPSARNILRHSYLHISRSWGLDSQRARRCSRLSGYKGIESEGEPKGVGPSHGDRFRFNERHVRGVQRPGFLEGGRASAYTITGPNTILTAGRY